VDFEVIWSQSARNDLQAIVAYISVQSPAGAERVADGILARVDQLRTFPYLGAVYERSRDGRIREILSGRYRIFYQVTEDARRVDILNVWHGARSEPRLPDNPSSN
jgi:toxin ParE1/3/4